MRAVIILIYPGAEFMRCIDVARRWTDNGMMA
jgi:hypothetical protein